MDIDSVRRMDVPTLAAHIDKQDCFVVDLRKTSHGDMIYGSIRYDPHRLSDAERLVIPLPKGSGIIVLVDEDGRGKRLQQLTEKFRTEGYGELFILDGGFSAWTAADGKLQERSMEQPVPGETSDQATR